MCLRDTEHLKFEATQYSVGKALDFAVGFKLQVKVLFSREFLVLLLVRVKYHFKSGSNLENALL